MLVPAAASAPAAGRRAGPRGRKASATPTIVPATARAAATGTITGRLPAPPPPGGPGRRGRLAACERPDAVVLFLPTLGVRGDVTGNRVARRHDGPHPGDR